jgi:3-deoxy-manno-octulosonate cytidylyltransferase (CMP-KDO synthetase)
MRCVGIIPARMGASRFPGKVLAPIAGLTMLEHVYRRARLCELLDEVIVATCDPAIQTEAQRISAPVVMTSACPEGAAQRVAEAAARIEADLIVMIQADEPLLNPAMVGELLAPFGAEPGLPCANLMLSIGAQDALDPDQVKVVTDTKGDALYMSREPVPTPKRGQARSWWRQIGIVAFHRAFLLQLMALPATPLEKAESVDMLRAIEYGFKVRMVATGHLTHPVDAPEDLLKVEALLKEDRLVKRYAP